MKSRSGYLKTERKPNNAEAEIKTTVSCFIFLFTENRPSTYQLLNIRCTILILRLAK